MSELNKIALKILSNGKGILAADESNGTMTKRLESVNVSSYKITPPIQFFILSEVKRVSLNRSLFSDVDWTSTDSNLFVIVPLLSSAARIPLPLDSIFKAILLSSDI